MLQKTAVLPYAFKDAIPYLLFVAGESQHAGRHGIAYEDVSDAFIAINDPPFRRIDTTSNVFALIERYVVITT